MVAELVAAGCGDWDVIEANWSLARVRAVQVHWREVAPPAHVSLAALAGFKAPAAKRQVDDPQELAAALRAMGVMA